MKSPNTLIINSLLVPGRLSPEILAVLALCIMLILGFLTQLGRNPAPSQTVPGQAIQLPTLPENTLRFVVLGDSGSGSSQQYKLARQLVNLYEKEPFGLVVMLGDNIYPNGNVKKYGYERFTKPYKPLLASGVKFRPALGNHDVLGRYDKDNMAFFNMPGPYYDYTYGDIHFFVLNTVDFDQTQQKWLRKRLAASNSPWKIVYGHHPVYSSGYHGSSSNLIRDLKPLLEIYRVNLYLSGHDHSYERIEPRGGVHYIVSGGGGAGLYGFLKPLKSSLVRQSVHHFLFFQLHKNTLYLQAVDINGNVIDTAIIKPQPATSLEKAA